MHHPPCAVVREDNNVAIHSVNGMKALLLPSCIVKEVLFQSLDRSREEDCFRMDHHGKLVEEVIQQESGA